MLSLMKEHFRHYAFVYGIILVLFPLLVDWGASIRLKVQDDEKVVIFIGAKTVDEDKMKTAILQTADQNLLEAKIITYDPSDSAFSLFLSSSGVVGTDFLLLPKESYSETFAQTYFEVLDLEKWNERFGLALTPIEVAGKDYGFRIYDKSDNVSYMDDYLSYADETAEEYGLFINRKSQNFSSLFGSSTSGSDHAAAALQTLLGETT